MTLAVKDRSGEAKVALWEFEEVQVQRGNVLHITNVRKGQFDGKLQITCSSLRSKISVSKACTLGPLMRILDVKDVICVLIFIL